MSPERVARREEFAGLLRREGRTALVELGTGHGRDAAAFVRAGISVSGIDLSAEHVRLAGAAGVDARQASVCALPFENDRFDCGWTMNTLLHVPDDAFDLAMSEATRVLTTGAPLAVGLWGGPDRWEMHPHDRFDPPRFFAFRSDDRLRGMLERHGTVERFETWPRPTTSDLHYQWCLMRVC